MSVAFRRESDEEHLEPKFEVPIPPGPNLVTADGLERIRSRIAELESQVPALTEETKQKAAKRDLRYWRARLSTAQVQPVPSGETVAFGCRVSFVLAGKQRTIDIVGHDEAEPAQNRLAFTAPLARAMMDAQAGEFVDFNGKEEAIEIVSIAPLAAG
ncbi:GreA/GreB family elongation factor [Novosphingobium pentaromativorans]|uniref:GreA/GreB family elongation factor n=1 Tax=Novosphingobium pentaromativorans US6-1 TaxID=1088721 RepID=G6EIW6_9SPHN|nr:GreA/GreB family elongation factor [Novosphingobium pentaromativorans]AIT78927.1 nucleoside diphosphate kinase [Novosphingobium pentaromativorans US6-1]EHJ58725.1 GreA/GreB family elongation factor [Novosphingobium pentaromativorans US6-1]